MSTPFLDLTSVMQTLGTAYDERGLLGNLTCISLDSISLRLNIVMMMTIITMEMGCNAVSKWRNEVWRTG